MPKTTQVQKRQKKKEMVTEVQGNPEKDLQQVQVIQTTIITIKACQGAIHPGMKSREMGVKINRKVVMVTEAVGVSNQALIGLKLVHPSLRVRPNGSL